MTVVGNRVVGLLAGSLLLLFAFLMADDASAASPAPAPAEIVFSNGGRIVSVKADGSGRQVLTGRKNIRTWGTDQGVEDSEPQISPDGKHLLFLREGYSRHNRFFSSDYMVASRDGSGARLLHRSVGRRGRTFLIQPSWSPDGREVIFSSQTERGRAYKSSVVAVDLRGKTRTLYKLKPSKASQRNVPRKIDRPRLSPDGRSLLIGVSNIFDENPHLYIVDLATGDRRLLARKAVEGSWSPDGTRIVMSVLDSENPKLCDGDDCYPARTDIALIDADGGERHLLYRSLGTETGPRFSADGTRIAFDSTRNYPAGEASQEIYTITTEGRCLSWLTNGTPESTQPSWGPELDVSAAPASCGAGRKAPLPELRPDSPRRADAGTQLWFGPSSGPMLYSGGSTSRSFIDMEYDDCSSFDPTECGKPFYGGVVSKCLLGNEALGLFSGGFGKLTVKRGRVFWLTRYGKAIRMDLAMTARSIAYTLTFGRRSKVDGRRKLLGLKTIRGDRPVELTGQVRLPRKVIRLVRGVGRTFERTGSVSATAAKFNLPKKEVKGVLEAGRTIRRLGGAKPMRCPAGNSGGRANGSGGSTSTGSRVLRELAR